MTARALLLDYGGVLTTPVGASIRAFEAELGVPAGTTMRLLMTTKQVADHADPANDDGGIVGALERGELSAEAFEDRLRALLAAAGFEAPAGSLLERIFAAMSPAGALWEVARQARSAGILTALVSNSWGLDMYPRERLRSHLDELIISGEVGLRKPQAEIFELATARLGVEPDSCVFVDDQVWNVAAANALGMVGVHHTGDDVATAATISQALGTVIRI